MSGLIEGSATDVEQTTKTNGPHMLNDCATVPRDSKQTSACVTSHEVRRLREIRVLISHSDPLIAAGLDAVLSRRSDFKILTPEQGNGVRHPGEEHAVADVVIADFESALRLTSTGRESRRSVVILTHSDSEAQVCRALEHGVRGYLLLGCSPEELYDGIRSVYQGGVALGPRVASRIAENMKQQALTAREQSVLRQLTLGLSNKQIGAKFALAEGTIKTHIKAIFGKLKVRSRTQAIAIAHRRGLLG
jgi:two-component system response regulator DesR